MRHAWELVDGRRDEFVRMFYAELFVGLGDRAFEMFPSGMVAQRTEFARALIAWVVADDVSVLRADLEQLGADHRKFRVRPQHYELAGRALVAAWRRMAGDAWTPRIDAAVRASYDQLAGVMVGGALAHQDEPEWWDATVVARERLLPDFAVLRVRPDVPYPYRAGQYLTVEVPALRNVWRQMSISSAPRPDNCFELQVRAIGASGVSGALVMHTSVGDRLRIGPPRGRELVVDPGTVAGRGLLCVCSGTGAAPISAVVESLLDLPQTPPLYAFVGGRTSRDLYPVTRMTEQVRAGRQTGRVRVHGVLSDEPSFAGLRGRVERVVPTLRPWAKLGVDVLVAGPNGMVDGTVSGLLDSGVPAARIHVDRYDIAA